MSDRTERAAHTPGPWRVEDGTSVYGSLDGYDGFVCNTSDHGHDSDHDKANATLIASAPNMVDQLAALESQLAEARDARMDLMDKLEEARETRDAEKAARERAEQRAEQVIANATAMTDQLARERNEAVLAKHQAERERDEARATVTKLNRRCQEYERGLAEKVRTQNSGVSMGRGLANAAATMYRERLAEAEGKLAMVCEVLRYVACASVLDNPDDGDCYVRHIGEKCIRCDALAAAQPEVSRWLAGVKREARIEGGVKASGLDESLVAEMIDERWPTDADAATKEGE